jgi:MSHA biogenesis protein MshM
MPAHPFGLSENPFADGHDVRFVYPARVRAEAVALLRKRIADGEPFVTITGEPGSGKTSVVTELLEDETLKAKVAFIAHPSLTPSELLEAVCIEFGAPLPGSPSKPQMLASLEHHLRELRHQGLAPVLVLDEAHLLKTELLEETRLLSNMKPEGQGLLQTILVGVPELDRRLGLPELAQLRQRIAVHVRIAPLTVEETEGYVRHRVDAAGGDGAALFPRETCQELHNYTNGFPRDLNTLARRALECAAQDGAEAVRVEDVRVAAGDARPHGIAGPPRPSGGTQPFELRRAVRTPHPAPQVARAFARPAAPAPVPASPPRPTEVAPTPPLPEIPRPPSFLRTQQIARAGEAMVPANVAVRPGSSMLERGLRSGDITAAESGGEETHRTQGTPGLLGSEGVRELGASVLLVGLLVVALMATGRWDPVVPPVTPPSGEPSRPSEATEVVSDPTRAGVAVVSGEPVADPGLEPPTDAALGPPTDPSLGPPTDPSPEPPAEPSRLAPSAAPPAVVPPPANPTPPNTTMPDLSLGGARGIQRGIGFEVASSVYADTAAAALRRITRGSKLPCRIVTKSSGVPYRVVVGPFATRREAEKAISELFRHALVERARVVQIVD